MKGFFLGAFFLSSLFRPGTSLAQNILGQETNDYNSKAPEVQQMKKMVDVPMNLFTGAPDIKVPVYTVSTKTISTAVTLRYSSGGIRAMDEASTYGLGWTLEAGGSITRTIRGNEDEGLKRETKPHKIVTTTTPFYKYEWVSARDSLSNQLNRYGGFYADGGGGTDATALKTLLDGHNAYLFDGNYPPDYEYSANRTFFNGLEDKEPDLFYFNFGGYSGKFIFGNSRVPSCCRITLISGSSLILEVRLTHL